MLSDEEKYAIDYLKIYIERDVMYENRHYKQIEIILNLIEKQSKEIEELKEKSMHITKETVEFVNSHYIHKDKIKAKIEECREILYSFEKELELKANKDKFIHKESMNCLLGQISVLQSLLEEE